MDASSKSGMMSDGSSSTYNITPIWRTWGEYCLAPRWREWVISKFGIDPKQVKIDLFADEKNAARSTYITKEMDAFSYDWGKLATEEEILWANPPFTSMEKVLSKVCREPTQMLLCCPERPEAIWWGLLSPLTNKKLYLPKGEELYYGVIQKDILPPPKWRTIVYWLDSRGYQGPPPRDVVLTRIEKNCKGYGKEKLQPDTEHPKQGQEEGGVVTTPVSMPNMGVTATKKLEPIRDEVGTSLSGIGVRIVGSEYEEVDPSPVHLRIGVVIQGEGMEDVPAKVLVDTGAEVNLIRRGIVPPHYWSPAEMPLKLVAANNQRLPGGRNVATVYLQFSAVESDSRKKVSITAPTPHIMRWVFCDLVWECC